MTEKDLKKLNRYQLLEMLILQTERADQLQARLESAEQQLNSRELKISTLGSVAEASLHLNGVFQAAQEAADMYIEAARKRAEEMEAEACQKAEEILAQARLQAEQIKGE